MLLLPCINAIDAAAEHKAAKLTLFPQSQSHQIRLSPSDWPWDWHYVPVSAHPLFATRFLGPVTRKKSEVPRFIEAKYCLHQTLLSDQIVGLGAVSVSDSTRLLATTTAKACNLNSYFCNT